MAVVAVIEMKREEISSKIKPLDKLHFAYLLWKGSEVVYVGASSTIPNRLLNHKYSKDFDRVTLHQTQTRKEAAELEFTFTESYRPPACQLKYAGRLSIETKRHIHYNRLKVALAEKSISNKWLAEKLNVTMSTVSGWVTNATQPSLDTLFKIAELLQVKPCNLLNKNPT